VLSREIQAGKDEFRHLNVIIADISTEKEAYISKLVDKRRKLEAELGASEHLRDEVRQLRGEIDKLITARKELSAEAASLMEELNREQPVQQQLPVLKTELDGLQQELIHVRYFCSFVCSILIFGCTS
jgi:seryl-tRNA synthetase